MANAELGRSALPTRILAADLLADAPDLEPCVGRVGMVASDMILLGADVPGASAPAQE